VNRIDVINAEKVGDLIHIVDRPSEGLAVLTVCYFGKVYREQLWAKGVARKAGTCAATGREFDKGAAVYHPVTHGHNRGQRIHAVAIES
jgi:hypothetical protein